MACLESIWQFKGSLLSPSWIYYVIIYVIKNMDPFVSLLDPRGPTQDVFRGPWTSYGIDTDPSCRLSEYIMIKIL